MKSISASIIVLAGAVVLAGGSLVHHNDTQQFIQMLGCLVGAIGLGGWIIAFKGHDPK